MDTLVRLVQYLGFWYHFVSDTASDFCQTSWLLVTALALANNVRIIFVIKKKNVRKFYRKISSFEICLYFCFHAQNVFFFLSLKK